MYEDIKTAALYVRYSSANQTEQSIEGQTRVCTEFCQRHGIQIVKIYADRATSASKDLEKRVEFLEMIRDAEKHPFDAVVVYKLDRFSRSRYDMATYKYKLKRNGVVLISATEQISQDPEGIILESVLEGMAEFYSAELSQKINRGFRESALKHNVVGGRIPLGYKIVNKKLVINEETAPIVREAFELFANGTTMAEICRIFNAKGYRTSKNARYGKSSFSKLFRNEVYIGTYKFHEYRSEDTIPAIINRELWDRVQSRLADYPKPGSYKAVNTYLLTGKAFCGHCGSNLNGAGRKSRDLAYYICYGKVNQTQDCEKRAIRKDVLEGAVLQDAISMLTDENIEMIADTAVRANDRELEQTTNIPAYKARIQEINKSLNNLTKAIETGDAPEVLVKRLKELEKEKRTIENQLKTEEKSVMYLDKAKIIYWLESFRSGDIYDETFAKRLIDLFVNSVTVWDEPDNVYKITIAYNLLNNKKTYQISNDTSSNSLFWHPNVEVRMQIRQGILLHTVRFHQNRIRRQSGSPCLPCQQLSVQPAGLRLRPDQNIFCKPSSENGSQ